MVKVQLTFYCEGYNCSERLVTNAPVRQDGRIMYGMYDMADMVEWKLDALDPQNPIKTYCPRCSILACRH